MATATADVLERAIFEARHRITVEESRLMADSGALGPEPRVYELIKGVIVKLMPEGPDHVQACVLIDDLLHRVVPAGYFVSMGHPLVDLPDDSAPVPDAMVMRGRVRDYRGRDLSPADAALVVEVAQTSLPRDRGWKKDLYAEMGVPVYWVVNLVDLVLEVYRTPSRPKGGGPARYAIAEKPRSSRSRARLVLNGTNVHEFLVREVLP